MNFKLSITISWSILVQNFSINGYYLKKQTSIATKKINWHKAIYNKETKIIKKLLMINFQSQQSCGHWVSAQGTGVTRLQPLEDTFSVINMWTRHASDFGTVLKLFQADATFSNRAWSLLKSELLQSPNGRLSRRSGFRLIILNGLQNYRIKLLIHMRWVLRHHHHRFHRERVPQVHKNWHPWSPGR